MSAAIKIQASDVVILVSHYAKAVANIADALSNNSPAATVQGLFANLQRLNQVCESLLAFIAAEQAGRASPEAPSQAVLDADGPLDLEPEMDAPSLQ